MTREKITTTVQKIIADHLGLDATSVQPDKSLMDDLMADSLDSVELVMAFEEEYEIEIPDDDAERFIKVSDIIDYLEKRHVA